MKTPIRGTGGSSRFPHAAAFGFLLAMGTQAALAAGAVYPPSSGPAPGSYFTPFAQDASGNEPSPRSLAEALVNGSVFILDAQFQGNTGTSLAGGGEPPPVPPGNVPDTILGFDAGDDGTVDYSVDDNGPLGDGLAEALGGVVFPATAGDVQPFDFYVSGYDDFTFSGNHAESGDYLIYFSVLDGVNDPELSNTDWSDWNSYEPAPFVDGYDTTTADLVISNHLFAGEVHEFAFQPYISDTGDSEFFYDGDVVGGTYQDSVQDFADLLEDGYDVLAVIDNAPWGDACEDCDYYGGDGSGGASDFMGSASYVQDMNLGTVDGKDLNFGDGILLTSGVGTPPDTNTSGSFSGTASEQGDAALDQLLQVAGDQGLIDPNTISDDATALSFNFLVPSNVNAVSLDFMYGTEEYPNWNYPDVAAIIIDGRNYAIFEDGTPLIFDPDTPVADILVNNDYGTGTLPIEYDGISPVRHLVAPLDPNLTTHTFKAVVSDARDRIYDTGLFLGNLQTEVVPAGLDPSDPILPPPDDDPTDGFDFRLELGDAGVGLDPTTPIWIDPEVAVGYVYTVTGNAFASATLPAGYGDDLYLVSWWDAVNGVYQLLDSGHDGGQFLAGEIINFLTLVDSAGITQFKVEGIEIAAGVNPDDPGAFMTGVSFVQGGTFSVNMNPITAQAPSVPEPALLFLLGGGLLGLGGLRRRFR